MGRMIDLGTDGQKLPVYVSEPLGIAKGGLIVIQEVWGLVEHIKSVADRFSKEGYLVIAPGLLNEIELSEQLVGKLQRDLFDPVKRSKVQPKLRSLMAPMQAPDFAERTVAKLEKCFDYLYSQELVHQNVAVLGFCFGGSYSFSLAVNEPRLKAALPFYGHSDFSVAELRKIKCPVRAFYGELDARLIDGLPKLKADMKAAGVDFKAYVYPGCGHAFFNDSNPYAYNTEAAKDSMKKALNFLAVALA